MNLKVLFAATVKNRVALLNDTLVNATVATDCANGNVPAAALIVVLSTNAYTME